MSIQKRGRAEAYKTWLVCLVVSAMRIAQSFGGNCKYGNQAVLAMAAISGNQKAVVVSRDAVSERCLQELDILVSEVKNGGKPHLVHQHRNFGESQHVSIGHEVTYLHEQVSDSLQSWMKNLMGSRLCELGYSETVHTQLNMRCLEAIEYYPEGQGIHDLLVAELVVQSADDNRKALALSYHRDGSTVCTMSIALSSADQEFEGGQFEISPAGDSSNTIIVSKLMRGDVLCWRGWDDHRVHPLRSGRRCVVVSEWWLGRPCSNGNERPQDTVEVIRRTLEFRQSAQLNVLLGQVYVDTKDYLSAVDAFLQALKLNRSAEACSGLATVALMRRDLEEAEAYCRSAIEIEPSRPSSHHELGIVMAQQGFCSSAADSFRAAVELDPQFSEAHHNLAVMLLELGRIKEALQSLGIAYRLEPQGLNLQHFIEKADAIAERDIAEAAEIYRAVMTLDPQQAKTHQ